MKLSKLLKLDWYMAKIECALSEMELVSIESQEEQEAIVKEIGLIFLFSKST